MRLATLTVLSLSKRTSMTQDDEAMSVFTHSGPFSACGERQKPAKRRRPASELLLARIRKTQVTDSPEMSTMPHRTSTLNDPHTELAYKI